ncbi:MAG TPA: BREX-6 system adenine-specific DNA-methyltransferase PglX [Leptolyngbyaceae cyanobacterium]
MKTNYLTPEAKFKLSNTVRELCVSLLRDIHNAADSVYRLSIPLSKAGLAEEQRIKRERLEKWLDEQARSEARGKKETREQANARYRLQAEKLAAATFLNRIVVIKQMEAMGLIKPAVLTGGWQSPAYREFREFAPDLLKDETEGFGTLLQLLYDELALDLPGLFGDVGVTSLFPIPASTLRATIEVLDNPELKTAWLDDTTLGWVYQYWNDPEREELDKKLNAGGKVEPHEVASKTQMFTERYMVEWLLHNSLGQMWLAICEKQGWTAEVQADGTLDRLEERRKVWREKREKGEVALDALMPIKSEAEERWKYWVPQPLTDAAVAHAPKSIWDIKLLDPACGSGHFLVIAFGLLFALYQEEARHRGEEWSDKEIVESILSNNLYGVDIDARSVQIAAAALLLKAKSLCRDAELKAVNLVASDLNLSALPENDPALVELRQQVTEATGIPEELTNQIVQALKGADQWGSLLKIDREVEKAIAYYEQTLARPVQGNLFAQESALNPRPPIPASPNRKDILLEKLEQFLSRRTSGDDLGLRLRGEQLTAGVRFIRLIRENAYDVVVGNPPYQGASKMDDAKYLVRHYSKGKADLFAAFLERGLELVKPGGNSALLTMRNWMFLNQYSEIREYLLDNFDLRVLGDLDQAAFEDVTNSEVLTVVMSVFVKNRPIEKISVALRWVQVDEGVYDRGRTRRKIAAFLTQAKRFEFHSDRFDVIKEKPLIYWWDDEFLNTYSDTPKLGELSEVRAGLNTSSNERYIRLIWEVDPKNVFLNKEFTLNRWNSFFSWVPTVMGAKGKRWLAPLLNVVLWKFNGLEMKVMHENRWGSHSKRVQNESKYFVRGVAFPKISSEFVARAYTFTSIFNDAAPSVFPNDIAGVTCLLNSTLARDVMRALNPTVNFQVGDVNRLPLFPIESADEIFTKLDVAFTEHEAARETSVEFKKPGRSAWNYAQDWAQRAVDREPGTPLPDYQPIYEDPPPTNFVSYAIGVALGRFGANGGGILNEAPKNALPNGILYLSTYSEKDSLQHPAYQIIKDAWTEHSNAITKNTPLKKWLRESFFKDVHLGMYESRPIYFPLSSAKKNFVAFVSIHRWQDNTLQTLLADYLYPELNTIEGELSDLIDARHQGDKKDRAKAEKCYSEVQKLYEELKTFCDKVSQCAEQGPPPANPKDTRREADARFQMDLDDGVMINSAALWSLLEPQWTKPKTWWSELCNAQGKKDYDWAHLAARYFPKRVDEKCQKDPSLAVAHGCFWKYHPAKAYAWELRLQDEISPDFTIEENSDALRQEFEEKHPQLVEDLIEAEDKRRERKRKKEEDSEAYGPLFDSESTDESITQEILED